MGMSPEVLANMYKWVDAQSFILEEEIIKAQADQMSRSMDYQLLVDNMVNQGWEFGTRSDLIIDTIRNS
jgi:hypothetical protein